MTAETEQDCPQLTAAQQQAVLRNLRQQTAAWLLGKSTTWIRDHAHQFDRSAGGHYDVRDLFALVGSESNGAEPAYLSDEHYEALSQALYDRIAENEGHQTGFVRVLNEIEATHGTSGLAAIGQFVKAIAEKHLQDFPHHERVKTEAEIRSEGLARIDREIEDIPKQKAFAAMRGLTICERCGDYRWGRQWKKPPAPKGYVADDSGESMCDDCSAT